MLNVQKFFALVPQYSTRWLEGVYGLGGGTAADRVLRLLTASLMAFGLYLRCRGVLFGPTLALWSDESQWLVFLETQPLTELLIRPIAFMGLTKLLVNAFPPTEFVVRLVPWLGGLASVLLAPALANRLCGSRAARLFLVAAIALHPAAIDLGRDFKPYSLGLAFHISVLILACNYVASGRWRSLLWVLGAATLGVLFAQDIVFLYPALFLTLAAVAWRNQRTRHLAAIAGSAILAGAIVLSLYLVIWKHLDQSHERDYWGNRYDVFYVGQPEQGSQLGWLAAKSGDVLAMPGMRRDHWESPEATSGPLSQLASLDRALWVGLALCGLGVLVWRRRFHELLLLAGPLVVLTLFNWIGRWPFGAFRTNLFLLAYVTPLCAVAFDFPRTERPWLAALPAAALIVAPFFFLNQHFHSQKHTFAASSYFPDVIEYLLRTQGDRYRGPRELLAMDTRSCADWRYYVRYHPRWSERRNELEIERFSIKCGRSTRGLLTRSAAAAERGQRIWGVASGDQQLEELGHSMKRLKTVHHRQFGNRQIAVGFERR